MSEKTHWLQSPNKNYLGHWDLPESGELIVTIESAQWEAVKNPVTNKEDSKRVIRFVEDIKPLICNQTNAQSIVTITGEKWMEDSGGMQICLHVSKHYDRVAKQDIDCIRIKAAVGAGNELSQKKTAIRNALNTYAGVDLENIRTMCQEKNDEQEFTIEFADSILLMLGQ